MVRYFTSVGPEKGPYLDRDATAAIGVLMAPDKPMPIGIALPIGNFSNGVALWRLTVREAEVPGIWFVVDREFRPAQ